MEWDAVKKPLIWRPDFLCKWCLTYVGQRRLFCSADCAAQYKICQKRREQRQDLNISVDYYGNVKLCVQGLPLISHEDIAIAMPAGEGIKQRSRRRKRCRYCSKLLKGDNSDAFCDEMCEEMEAEKNRREEFINIFQQKEAAERRRIRKWLMDAQEQYTKLRSDLPPINLIGEDVKVEKVDIKEDSNEHRDTDHGHTSSQPHTSRTTVSQTHSTVRRTLVQPRPPRRSGLNFMGIDEAIVGGPVHLNPIPLRKTPVRPEKQGSNSDRRHLMVDLKWIPRMI